MGSSATTVCQDIITRPLLAVLTNDILHLIFKQIPATEIVKMTRVCKGWDSMIRQTITTLKTGGLVLTEGSSVTALYIFLAKTTSVTALDLEVAGGIMHRLPSIVRLSPLSQLTDVTLATGTYSTDVFGDLVESLSF